MLHRMRAQQANTYSTKITEYWLMNVKTKQSRRVRKQYGRYSEARNKTSSLVRRSTLLMPTQKTSVNHLSSRKRNIEGKREWRLPVSDDGKVGRMVT